MLPKVDLSPMSRSHQVTISFLLFTYNQEDTVREAVLGALAQDEAFIEIIISDDASSDGTFAVIEEATRDYDGPHRLMVRRNPVNRGWIAHFNEVSRMAKGEWIVMAAGDDVSFPGRSSTVSRLARANPSARSIFLGVSAFGEGAALREIPVCEDGVYRFPERFEVHGAVALGASQAWHRGILETFGDLPEDLLREDALLPFRAGLIGEVVVDNTPAVRYRVSADSLSQGYFKRPSGEALLKAKSGELAEIEQMEKDLRFAASRGWVEQETAGEYLGKLEVMRSTARVSVALLNGPRWERIRAAVAVLFPIGRSSRICGNWRFRLGLSRWAFR